MGRELLSPDTGGISGTPGVQPGAAGRPGRRLHNRPRAVRTKSIDRTTSVHPPLLKKPNFFLLGAAKCGTTSLYRYLVQHPEIYMSPIKEPSFFSRGFQGVRNPIDYFELYQAATSEKAIGEASHVYMTNPPTARVLQALFPDARFIVILRNPAERAYSLYHYMVRIGYEHVRPFERALEIEDARWESPGFRARCPHYFYNYLYFRSGLYGEQLERYLAYFPRAQFHIVTFNDFVRHPMQTVREIYRFLGVSTEFSPEIEIHNRGDTTQRWPLLAYMTRSRFGGRGRLARLIRRATDSINVIDRPPMREETKRALMSRYASDLERLHKLTGIRLH